MASVAKQRNQSVDILRGIAMLLVVLGHTMTGCTSNSEQSFLFNIIWSLQMPLFFIISGYVTRYSRPITNSKALGNFILRRTVSYMLPFMVWTFVIRGIVFGQTSFFNIKHLAYNMDSGYWFLFSIYVIAIIFGISEFISNLLNKKGSQYKSIVLNISTITLSNSSLLSISTSSCISCFSSLFTFLCCRIKLS